MNKQLVMGLITGGFLAVPALAAPVDDIRVLLEQNKPQEAYHLGRRHPAELGNPAFDFYFGIASLDIGQAGEGVLALERYLLNFPDNRSARFHLARGYFILGEDQRARDEFETLQPAAQGPEKIGIERFLDAIRARETRYLPSANAFIEAGLGWDTNLNAGIDGGTRPTIPGMAMPALSVNSVSAKESGGFTALAGGLFGNYPVAPGVSLYAAGAFDAKLHSGNVGMFDQINYGVSGGASHLAGRHLLRAGVGYGQVEIDDQRYILTTSINGDWQYQWDQFNRANVGLQFATFDYQDVWVHQVKNGSAPKVFSPNSVRTSDYTGLSLGWTRSFNMPYQPTLAVLLSAGNEINRKNRPDLSRDIAGTRFSVNWTPLPQWGAAVGLAYQENRYRGPFTVFAGDHRHDRNWAADASLSYYYSKNLTFKVDAVFAEQRSNIGLYSYDRDMVTLKVRHDFK